ncbi:MAG: sodium:solute symporter family transporter, partial [Planctomycetota bacterium]
MNTLDYVVLVVTIATIAAYGGLRARRLGNRQRFFKTNRSAGWITIGLSAMATQAGPITFISMPGLAYETGMGFVQNYFGLPLALIVVSVVFLPLYQRLHVDTAYEFLGWRFDAKTRLLGAGLFLLQRGLLAGVTIYAPAIILSAILGWRLDLTIVVAGLLVVAYTVRGGSGILGLTQELQMGVLLVGMAAAFFTWQLAQPDEE